MTANVTQAALQPDVSSSAQFVPGRLELALLILGVLVLYVPTYRMLSEQVWSQDGQGHGPVMLMLTLWLAWKRLPELAALPAKSAPLAGVGFFVAALLFYVLGRSQDFPEFEAGSQIPLLVGMLLLYRGWPGVKLMWFPLFFILFLVPLPHIVVMTVTAPLKAGVSYVAEGILYQAGYPIGRTGVTLTIGQYKLLVADACAGLNSIFALESIGVFYLSVVGYTNKWRKILLALLILPISFVSNVIRVIVLVLVTYYFGDEAGQGFVHGFAGILLFMVATIFTIGTDNVIGLFVKPHSQAKTA
ncbi:MAG: exosortase B [Burkholderiales bacterium]|nr:exosortase B [Burkholderiales bacterium]